MSVGWWVDLFNAFLNVVVMLWPPRAHWSVVKDCSDEAGGTGLIVNVYSGLSAVAGDAFWEGVVVL